MLSYHANHVSDIFYILHLPRFETATKKSQLPEEFCKNKSQQQREC